MPSDLSIFLRQLIKQPREISAAIPSSKRLATAMANAVPNIHGSIAEFGPGTGIITQALLDRGASAARMTLLEINSAFAKHLRHRFPDVNVINKPAQELQLSGLSAVVSGLPLLSIPTDIQEKIVSAAMRALAQDGVFIQFTYGRAPSVSPELIAQFNLSVQQHSMIWRNIPPARVHVFRAKTH